MKANTLFLLFFLPWPQLLSGQQQSDYEAAIDTWHEKRIQELKAPDGWLNLAGLYWLQPGLNSFGSGDNNLVYENPVLPSNAGYFEWWGKAVKWFSHKDAAVSIKGRQVREAAVFHTDSTTTPVLELGPLRWFVIKREDKMGVRLRNLEHTALTHFTGVDRFPVDSNWRVRARLLPAIQNRIAITNVLGQTTAQSSPGKLSFSIKGTSYQLDVLEEGQQLFIIFGDATSGESTYISGRFLYADKPGPDGFTVIDFNKAINPPCAFTPFATCPLPPPQNILPITVTAGEKNFHLK